MMTLPALLGINLWLITLVVPLGLSATPPSPAVYYLLPFCPALLFLGLRGLRGRPLPPWALPALLLGVPLLCFLPVADGPLADPALHPRPAVVLQGAVLLCYLAAVCHRAHAPVPAPVLEAGEPLPAPETTPLDPGGVPAHWARRRALYLQLIGYSALCPALLLYAINLHPGTQRLLRLSFQSPAQIGAVQAAATAAAALLWVVAYHACLLAPMRAHLDHDRTTLGEIAELRRMARRGRPRAHFYIAMSLALGSMIMLIWRSLHP